MLATKTQFNFDLIDRWGHSVLEELKDEETKARIIELVIQKKGKRIVARWNAMIVQSLSMIYLRKKGS